VKIMQKYKPDVMYLSTTDYVQHKHAPGTDGANAFYRMMDGYMQQLEDLGCVIVLTADHGMNAKVAMDGTPDVIYLQDWFDGWLGAGMRARDPAHHRSLCGAPRRTGFLRHGLPARGHQHRGRAQAAGGAQGHGAGAGSREQAAERFELPADRIGDIVAVSERFTVIGTSASRHDLSGAGSAAALARRHERAARAADREPQAARAGPQPAFPQLRCL
jgi:phosphonoacetate hydrolase